MDQLTRTHFNWGKNMFNKIQDLTTAQVRINNVQDLLTVQKKSNSNIFNGLNAIKQSRLSLKHVCCMTKKRKLTRLKKLRLAGNESGDTGWQSRECLVK